jgi:hypothetical protein
MTKQEMQDHHTRYRALMSRAGAAEREGLFRAAVDAALAAWKHIDGMMQYARKYENAEFNSIPALDLVLRYSPLLLDSHRLDSLESLLNDCRRIAKNTAVDEATELERARARMWAAHRLWDHLEQHPGVLQSELRAALGGDQSEWREIATAWGKMGLVRRAPDRQSYRLSLCTRMGEIIAAKCPSCGHITEAPKAMLLDELICPNCRTKAPFVLLGPDVASNAGT